MDTYKEGNRAVPGKDCAYSTYLFGCYLLWGSFVSHFRKFLFLFIFDRTYSFTSPFLYRANYRCGGADLIYDSIYGFSSSIRERTHFTYGSGCALLSHILFLSVTTD